MLVIVYFVFVHNDGALILHLAERFSEWIVPRLVEPAQT
jgi:hypothetical protein